MQPQPSQKLNQAIDLFQQGQLDQAEALCQELLRSPTEVGSAHWLLSFIENQRSNLDGAIEWMHKALDAEPRRAEWHENLGAMLAATGRTAEGERAFRLALTFRPNFPSAWNNLGVALSKQRRFDEAREAFQKAVEQKPDYAEAAMNLADCMRNSFARESAAGAYQRVLELQPQNDLARMERAASLLELGRFAEAEALLQDLLRRQPNDVEALALLGSIYSLQLRGDDAERVLRQAIALQPSRSEPHQFLAYWLLSQGHWEEGLAKYEWRRWGWANPSDRPYWQGEELPGKTLLCFHEQGFGDTFMAVRFLPILLQFDLKIIFRVPEALAPLIRLSLDPRIKLVTDRDPLPPHDAQIALMSVLHLLQLTPERVPAKIPYLQAHPERVEFWKQQLAPLKGRRIGICWQGNKKFGLDEFRSLHPRHFEPLAKVPGVHLLTLQMGEGAELAKSINFPLLGFGEGRDRETGAFMDTAAILKNLDLVVTSDTSLVHLAGAMGVPTWLALAAAPDWRWLHGRNDTPWYPTVRLFRQTTLGDWDDVFARMAKLLARLGAGGFR